MGRSLFLEGTVFGGVTCKIHPVVVWSILDHYSRRPESQTKVIGTLLGINFDGQIEVRNSFPVPHKDEGDTQVAVDGEFFKNMYELHHKAHPKELIVGWYSTGGDINDHTVLIHHEFFAKEVQQPFIHLTLDNDLKKGNMAMKAYVSSSIGVDTDKPMAVQFLSVPVELTSFEAERIGVDALIRAQTESTSSLTNDLVNLELSISKLLELLDEISKYVDKVLANQVAPNNKLGRFLADVVSALPKVDNAAFDKMFNASLQDLLMAVYLANLTRAQLSLSEKLERLDPSAP